VRPISKCIIASLIAGLAGLCLAPAAAALAATTKLPITSFYQIAADTAHGHLFISEGSSSINHILVTDFSGKQVATISGQTGVMGIALSADGSTLYAALSGAHAVTAIDTSTLTQTASYPIGSSNTPQDVAEQSGKVWVSYDTGTPGSATIGDIDVSSATPSFNTQANMGGWSSAPELAADPQNTGVLVAAAPGQSPSAAASYDTTVDPVTVRASGSMGNCENQRDLAVVPGGAQFILACGFPYAHFRYSAADLSQQGSYASTNYPDAIAIDTNGDVFAGSDALYAASLYVYKQNGDTALNTFVLDGGVAVDLAPRGVAVTTDGSVLFAVFNLPATTEFHLQVFDKPTLVQPVVKLAGPKTAYVTKSLTMNGSISVPSGSKPPAGTVITINRTIRGGTTKTFTVKTAAGGAFTVTDKPPAAGKYTYAASYAGSSTIAPGTGSHTVSVVRLPVSLTVSASPRNSTYERTVHVTAHLGRTASSRTVSIYTQSFGSSGRKLLKRGPVNARGILTVSYQAAHSATISVVYSGDAQYSPRTVKRAIYVRARVTESLSGYYGSTHIAGQTYRLYHHNQVVRDVASVSPNKARQCVTFKVQQHYRGAWRTILITGCATANSHSKALARFDVRHAARGYHYRIRANYVRGTDKSNLNNSSGWVYLIVRR